MAGGCFCAILFHHLFIAWFDHFQLVNKKRVCQRFNLIFYADILLNRVTVAQVKLNFPNHPIG